MKSNQDLIYEDIKKSFTSKSLCKENGRFPSLRDLAVKYNSSVGTVRQALVRLEFEKYIKAGHGKGYFVLPPEKKLKQVIVIERTGDDHLFSGFLNQFQKNFAPFSNISTLLEDPRLMKNERARAIFERICENPGEFEAVFFDTQTFENNFTKDELLEIMKKTKLFHYFHTSETCAELGIPGVATDWHHGGYIGVRHLIEIGCRNILIIVHTKFDFTKGCEEAVADSASRTALTFNDGSDAASIKKLFSENTFDAVYVFGDYLLFPIMPFFRELNMKIPGDIAILGYFNTPWVKEMAEVPLSSISIREDEMINEVCDMCLGRSIPCLKILKPKLIARESTIDFMNGMNRPIQQLAHKV